MIYWKIDPSVYKRRRAFNSLLPTHNDWQKMHSTKGGGLVLELYTVHTGKPEVLVVSCLLIGCRLTVFHRAV